MDGPAPGDGCMRHGGMIRVHLGAAGTLCAIVHGCSWLFDDAKHRSSCPGQID